MMVYSTTDLLLTQHLQVFPRGNAYIYIYIYSALKILLHAATNKVSFGFKSVDPAKVADKIGFEADSIRFIRSASVSDRLFHRDEK